MTAAAAAAADTHMSHWLGAQCGILMAQFGKYLKKNRHAKTCVGN